MYISGKLKCFNYHLKSLSRGIICNPNRRDGIMQKLINNADDAMSALVFLAIPVVFQ